MKLVSNFRYCLTLSVNHCVSVSRLDLTVATIDISSIRRNVAIVQAPTTMSRFNPVMDFLFSSLSPSASGSCVWPVFSARDLSIVTLSSREDISLSCRVFDILLLRMLCRIVIST